jgi:ATP-dependent protease ClpP protease subunit
MQISTGTPTKSLGKAFNLEPAAGTKGKRRSLPNARIMPFSSTASGELSELCTDLQDFMANSATEMGIQPTDMMV